MAAEYLSAEQVLAKTREYNLGVRNKAIWREGELFNLVKDIIAIRVALGLGFSGHSVLLGDKNLNFRLSSSKESSDVTRKELMSTEPAADPPVITERLRINRIYEDTPVPHDKFEVEVFTASFVRGPLSPRKHFFKNLEKALSGSELTSWAREIWRAHILDNGSSTLI